MRQFAWAGIFINVFMAGAWTDQFIRTGEIVPGMWGTAIGLVGALLLLRMEARP